MVTLHSRYQNLDAAFRRRGGGGEGRTSQDWVCFGIGGFDDFLHSLLQADDVEGAVLNLAGSVVQLLGLTELAEGVVPGAADAGFVAVEAGEGFVERFTEEFLARGLLVGEGRVDDLGFPLRDAEEFPFREGDLLDQSMFGMGEGGEVEFALKEEGLEVSLRVL